MFDMRIDMDGVRDLTRVTAFGQAAADQINDVIGSPEYGHTSRVIWDLRAASLSDLCQDELIRIASATSDVGHRLNTQAIAFVVRSNDARLLIKLFTELYRHKFGRSIHCRITSDMDHARGWLDRVAPPQSQPYFTGVCAG